MNANFSDLSDGPLKERRSVASKVMESSALQSYLPWLTGIPTALNKNLKDPNTRATIQAVLSDSLATLTTNTMLVRCDLAIKSLVGQVPKETLHNLKSRS